MELEDVDVEVVPESALETVVQNKVARVRYPDEIDDTDTISGEQSRE
ncbi:hypothetical protein HT576_05280 [Haloterrigena sp. SYSU A121-1]|uniref:Uncharacterized protein n=1 Tax=Haloterrigena gelatinilytica TaxID=2741724 RepID=A0A8J8KEC4_9EURY|nr:hypothetical protein [Haloterrigena gelatinilytica]NUB90446.1 hypothetical protein [Haloterrigena gelatinilytica]